MDLHSEAIHLGGGGSSRGKRRQEEEVMITLVLRPAVLEAMVQMERLVLLLAKLMRWYYCLPLQWDPTAASGWVTACLLSSSLPNKYPPRAYQDSSTTIWSICYKVPGTSITIFCTDTYHNKKQKRIWTGFLIRGRARSTLTPAYTNLNVATPDLISLLRQSGSLITPSYPALLLMTTIILNIITITINSVLYWIHISTGGYCTRCRVKRTR